MVRNEAAEFHVRCTDISIIFTIEKSCNYLVSVLIMKEMVWLMKAARPKASSFYFGLLTAIKCDTGTRELGTRLKVTSLSCLVLIR